MVNEGLLHSIISDAKIANLGDTYKGEVDLLLYNNSNMKCTKSHEVDAVRHKLDYQEDYEQDYSFK